ncbi:jg7607 [Pararge aegeria aegeria]|uniref:Jg7607 protein n=1 Tax=Pararge aegeria aegeria TaxID=348720 RepID=A0A8S4RHE9_9NEOP|nr:jg7607 [Pararge aegeria aegeria]
MLLSGRNFWADGLLIAVDSSSSREDAAALSTLYFLCRQIRHPWDDKRCSLDETSKQWERKQSLFEIAKRLAIP